MTVDEKIKRIEDLQCELTRLRWAEDYDFARDTEIRKEQKELATPDVCIEINKRLDWRANERRK